MHRVANTSVNTRTLRRLREKRGCRACTISIKRLVGRCAYSESSMSGAGKSCDPRANREREREREKLFCSMNACHRHLCCTLVRFPIASTRTYSLDILQSMMEKSIDSSKGHALSIRVALECI